MWPKCQDAIKRSIVVQHGVIEGRHVDLDQYDLGLCYVKVVELQLILHDIEDPIQHLPLHALFLRMLGHKVLVATLDY